MVLLAVWVKAPEFESKMRERKMVAILIIFIAVRFLEAV
jgi:hypothetical protein